MAVTRTESNANAGKPLAAGDTRVKYVDMRKDNESTFGGGARSMDGSVPGPELVSAFDTPLLAGNLAHELTNALFALHLHLDEPAAAHGRRNRGTNGARERGRVAAASRQAIDTVLSRLDELSRGLRLVSRVTGYEAPVGAAAGSGAKTSLADWWSLARVVVLVSVPKGIDIEADIPRELPAAVAGPAELTACAVMICRRVVGPGRVEPPCSLRLVARPEDHWIRMTVIAHGNSSHLEPVAATPHAANGARILVEKPDPLAASVLVARAAPRGTGGRAGLPGTVP